MQVSLDSEQWTVHDDTSLMEVLAQVSNKAQDRCRIVTSLKIGGRIHTDRDLVPALLARTGKDAGPVEATSSATVDILLGAKETVTRFGSLLHSEGQAMILAMRSGAINMATLDSWLGQLADYIEITDRAQKHQVPGFQAESLVPWAEELIEARAIPDPVRMADVLEYELVPRIRH